MKNPSVGHLVCPITTVLVPLIVLLAIFVPRQVPCGEYPLDVTDIKVLIQRPWNTSLLNDTETLYSSLLCFPPADQKQPLFFYLEGSFVAYTDPAHNEGRHVRLALSTANGSKELSDAVSKSAMFENCSSIERWMRVGVANCKVLTIEQAWTNLSSLIDSVDVKVYNPPPCNKASGSMISKQFSFYAIDAEYLNFGVDSLNSSDLCLGKGPFSISLIGSGFLKVNGTGPRVIFNKNVLPSSTPISNCTAIPGGPPDTVLETCTTINIVIDETLLEPNALDNILTVENPSPCSTTYISLNHPFAILSSGC